MSAIDELLANAARVAEGTEPGPSSARPAKRVAIVACMDARIDVYRLLSLREGDAHILRKAGGTVTDDVIRSLAISQRRLGTEEVLLIHHTDCGMLSFSDDEFRGKIEQEPSL